MCFKTIKDGLSGYQIPQMIRQIGISDVDYDSIRDNNTSHKEQLHEAMNKLVKICGMYSWLVYFTCWLFFWSIYEIVLNCNLKIIP